MVVNYILIYATNDGLERMAIPIEVNEEIDADHVYELCYEYLRKNTETGGLPVSADSTMKQYPSYCFSASNEVCEECHKLKDAKIPTPKNTSREDMGSRVWCLVDSLDSTDQNHSTTWIPGIRYADGRITSVLGELTSPDSPDDIKPFDECPFPGYTIVKGEGLKKESTALSDILNMVQPCMVTALITPVFGTPFLYRKEVPVIPGLLSVAEMKKYLCKILRQYIIGKEFSIDIYRYQIVSPFGDLTLPGYSFKSVTIDEYADQRLNYYLVRFEVEGQEDFVMACVVPVPYLQRNVHIYPPFYIRRNIEQMYPGKTIRLVDVERCQDYVTDLPVILEKDYLPSK